MKDTGEIREMDDGRALRDAIDAVCAELGLAEAAEPRRAAIEARMLSVYRTGLRHPLNLVDAGLGAA